MTHAPHAAEMAARRAAAMRIVHRYAGVSAMAGLIAVPGLDVAALGGVHISLIRDLTAHYGAEFSEHSARNIVIAIGASLVPGAIGSVLGHRVLAVLPYLAHGAGLLLMSASSAAASYGLGVMFVRHFEAGGTLDSFDAANLHQIFARAR